MIVRLSRQSLCSGGRLGEAGERPSRKARHRGAQTERRDRRGVLAAASRLHLKNCVYRDVFVISSQWSGASIASLTKLTGGKSAPTNRAGPIFFQFEEVTLHTSDEFQMVCADCGSLAITIANPEETNREAIVHCGGCNSPRGTMGGLRDLAMQADAHMPAMQRRKAKPPSDLVARHK
jgi:hypothetical protein